jgi:antitoxin HigA-1
MPEFIVKQRPSRQPMHPGEILRDDVIPATGLSVTEVSRRLGVSRQNLYRVLSGKGAITPEMALRLGRFCGNGPGIWLRLQQAHDLWEAERRLRPELRRMIPAPLALLARLGAPTGDVEQMLAEIEVGRA